MGRKQWWFICSFVFVAQLSWAQRRAPNLQQTMQWFAAGLTYKMPSSPRGGAVTCRGFDESEGLSGDDQTQVTAEVVLRCIRRICNDPSHEIDEVFAVHYAALKTLTDSQLRAFMLGQGIDAATAERLIQNRELIAQHQALKLRCETATPAVQVYVVDRCLAKPQICQTRY